MNAIKLKQVTKTYLAESKPAVKDLTLNIAKGSIVTLLGPSGCGKSTTLRLIAGFERADSGSIEIAGGVVSGVDTWIPPEKRGVGMVFQDYALFPHLNVFNNIGFGYKEKDRKERIMDVIDLVNLNGHEKKYVNQLSGGQQQRVALARALTRRPEVVLLDEPFSNLDADLRMAMRVEVKRIINEAGATAIFVSHDQKDALAISDKIVVMKDGIIQQVGRPIDIYNFPQNKFVANFVGKTNILDGKLINEQIVKTPYGNIFLNNVCHLTPLLRDVTLSVRPEGFLVRDDGDIAGRIISKVYSGNIIEATVEIGDELNKKFINVNLEPSLDVALNSMVKLKVNPYSVSIIS